MNTLQRSLQSLCLALFVLLFLAAGQLVAAGFSFSQVFGLDPAGYLGTALSTRVLLPGVAVLLLLLALTFLLGRFFCGHVCPLGTLCDAVRPAVAGEPEPREPGGGSWSRVKYLVLLLILASSLAGLNLAYWAAPLSLAGRFLVLVLGPVGEILASGLSEAGLLPDRTAYFLGLPPDRYLGAWFFFAFFAALLLLQRYRPRFWCRFLCPAGAVLALLSRRPVFRRTVSGDCTGCGLCRRKCPMGAIQEDPRLTRHQECIVCQRCTGICPEAAVSFRLPSDGAVTSGKEPFLPGRRAAVGTLAAAAAAVFVSRAGLLEVWSRGEEGKRIPAGGELIRPPGAMPENEFLNRCLRCGLCMRICPTDMLQPDMRASGWSGLKTPVAVPLSGPCEPGCTSCGRVCPSGAIRALSTGEKMWAKMGTAMVKRRRCLAWEWGKRCLVCDEACPFGALQLRREPGLEVMVPHVLEHRCTGCGSCENACPVVDEPAIAVAAMGEIRLEEGSYRKEGKRRGLLLSREQEEEQAEPRPGRREGKDSGLPPGFE